MYVLFTEKAVGNRRNERKMAQKWTRNLSEYSITVMVCGSK